MRPIASILVVFAAGCERVSVTREPKSPIPDAVVVSGSVESTKTEPAMPVSPAVRMDKSIMEQVMEEGGSLAVVRVTSATIEHVGTRSEAVRIESGLVRSIRGTHGANVAIRAYTSGGQTVLVPGNMYVVALFADARFGNALDLIGHTPTSDAQWEESVRLHKAMLEEMKR